MESLSDRLIFKEISRISKIFLKYQASRNKFTARPRESAKGRTNTPPSEISPTRSQDKNRFLNTKEFLKRLKSHQAEATLTIDERKFMITGKYVCPEA